MTQYRFHIVGQDTKFSTRSFTGFEALSTPYRFELELSSPQLIEDVETLLWQSCEFKMSAARERTVRGMVTEVAVTHKVNNEYFYTLTMQPAFWGLNKEIGCEVYLATTVIDCISDVLAKPRVGLQISFDMKVSETYEEQEIICKYNESSFHFVSRLMEHYGLYYYFEDQDGVEKLVITDNKIVHQKLEADKYRYYGPTGLDQLERENTISQFVQQRKIQSKNVLLKSYNYEKPDLEVEGVASINDKGVGQQYVYGEHFTVRKQGNMLAKLKAEQLNTQANLCNAQAGDHQMAPGGTFTLNGHFIADLNQDYLIVSVTHKGQAGSAENDLSYENTIECLSTQYQYRCEEKTPKAKIVGLINATIDAAGSDPNKMMDDQGRYKVRLPFDLSNPNEGKASHWVRMLTDFSDSEGGVCFPLRKGTEVKLACEHGDPNRFVIVGAVTNPNTPSVVNETNVNDHVIKTPSGSTISMSDGPSSSEVHIFSGDGNSFIKITS
ncbi:type VI secretion system tip protein VgrG [Vibrio sp. S4M6]|uniref:type VI secretion system Vgr family protein n=1 Tax=Vibrio sinus TaxID=2946865 RepID=UPI00202AB616|nr:type VI secretion system tip protein TssI/VgrG [Vibrio sinus]MCL9782505.1 type VI secretion system tip protein VgrG [Vibrio sinus]